MSEHIISFQQSVVPDTNNTWAIYKYKDEYSCLKIHYWAVHSYVYADGEAHVSSKGLAYCYRGSPDLDLHEIDDFAQHNDNNSILLSGYGGMLSSKAEPTQKEMENLCKTS